ncbi:nuclease C1-like isoform X2 [Drosophila guanche]|uniref:nuclease C1-like isoform X2 n=1 Tax=Drosophila guanche TaxID=7266 RepID=UPI0014709729|nr:nuclease C1-like isoform X2 [Drosophila guanche]
MTEPRNIAKYVFFGTTGFVFGAFMQQQISIKNLYEAINRDPYLYNIRQKLYPVARLWSRPLGLKDKISQLLMSTLFKYFVPKPLEQPGANILDLLKYGLPSSANLLVHRDYIMSRGSATNSASWLCEHFCADSLPVEDQQLSRYEDVFVPRKANSAAIGTVFKHPMWQELERYVSLLVQECGSVYAYTGPIFMPKTNGREQYWQEYIECGNNAIPVPSHYFKVLIVEQSDEEPSMEAFILRNEETESVGELCDYRVCIQDVETQAGLRFGKGLQSPKVALNMDNIEIDFTHASVSEPI